jgi:dTMP kinase
MFVVLEGIDASGKATQAKLLAKFLKSELVSFPAYDTPIGGLILGHLKNHWSAVGVVLPNAADDPVEQSQLVVEGLLDPMVFQALQFANRLEKAPEIQAALLDGGRLVADRYLGSSLAYGMTDGLDYDYLAKVQKFLPQPDINILVDISLEESMKRRPERRDRYEANKEFLAKVRESYQFVWYRMGQRTQNLRRDTWWVTVDGEGSVEEVHEEIKETIRKREAMRMSP